MNFLINNLVFESSIYLCILRFHKMSLQTVQNPSLTPLDLTSPNGKFDTIMYIIP